MKKDSYRMIKEYALLSPGIAEGGMVKGFEDFEGLRYIIYKLLKNLPKK